MTRRGINQLRELVIVGLHVFGYGCWVLAVISILFAGPIWGGLLGECGSYSSSGCDFIEYENQGTIILAALLSSLSSIGMGFLFLGVGMALKQIDVWTRGGA